MAQLNFTLDSEIIKKFLSETEKNEGIRLLIETFLNQILKSQSDEQIGLKKYQRSDERKDYRNGFYKRDLKTVNGLLNLNVPRHRKGIFETEIFQRFKRSEQALLASMMQMVISGVSTRKVETITEKLCGLSFSKSTVSNICKDLNEPIEAWKTRDLSTKNYPFILIDGIQIKVREHNSVTSKAALIALAIDDEGYRDILGIFVGDSESQATWDEFFVSLKERGLKGVDLIVSDAHKGLIAAARKNFQGIQWQRCQAHFMRNILDKTPEKYKDMVRKDVNAIFNANSKTTARIIFKEMQEKYCSTLLNALKIIETGFEDSLTVLNFPLYYQTKLRTTNHIERLNREIRRREQVITIFNGIDNVYRIVGSVLMEINESWMKNRVHIDMKKYKEFKIENS